MEIYEYNSQVNSISSVFHYETQSKLELARKSDVQKTLIEEQEPRQCLQCSPQLLLSSFCNRIKLNKENFYCPLRHHQNNLLSHSNDGLAKCYSMCSDIWWIVFNIVKRKGKCKICSKFHRAIDTNQNVSFASIDSKCIFCKHSLHRLNSDMSFDGRSDHTNDHMKMVPKLPVLVAQH